MALSDDALQQFFRDYAVASMGSDPKRVAEFYAGSFLVAGPKGSATFQNDHKFIDWLTQVHEFNLGAGMQSMEAVSVEQLQRLSDSHALVSVEWAARFRKTGDRLITFRIAYLLEERDGQRKILAYISEKDQDTEMRALGLL